MPSAKRDLSEPVELVRSDLRGLSLVVVPAVVVGLVVAAFGLGFKFVLLFVAAWGATLVGLVEWIRWTVGRNALFVDDRGLTVVTRGRAARSHDWARIRTASWQAGSLWTGWNPGGIMVTLEDDDRPVLVGSIVIVLPRAKREAGARVGAVIETHLPSEGT